MKAGVAALVSVIENMQLNIGNGIESGTWRSG
jgi:hypothetical protein